MQLALLARCDRLFSLCDQPFEGPHLDAHCLERLGHHDTLDRGVLVLFGRVVGVLLGVDVGDQPVLGELRGALVGGERIHLADALLDPPGAFDQRRVDRTEARGEPALEHGARKRDRVTALTAGLAEELLDVLGDRLVQAQLGRAQRKLLAQHLARHEQRGAVLVAQILLLAPQEVRAVLRRDLLGREFFDRELVGIEQPQKALEARRVTRMWGCGHQQEPLGACRDGSARDGRIPPWRRGR